MKKYISIILTTLAIAGSSCKKDYLNLATNPNVPSSASANLLLSGALKGTSAITNTGNDVQYAAWAGFLSQSTGYQPFVALEQYQFTTSSYDVWTARYININNYTALAAASTSPNYQAIAKIMIAFDFEGLVDNYNNVPYTQAIKGTGNLNPTYDKGSDIYADLMKQLDAAIVLIQGAPSTAANPTGSDIMFGGNMTNWIKFANTLKLRLALRCSSNPNIATLYGTLKAAASATASLGYLDGTTDARVQPGFTNSDANGGQQSPLWLYYGLTQGGSAEPGNAQYQANSYAANYLGSNGDARLIQIYSASSTPEAVTTTTAQLTAGSAINTYTAADGTKQAIVSTTFGDSQPPALASDQTKGYTPSKVGPGVLKSASMSAIILSGAEALFLQAEAAKNKIIPGNAVDFYNAGVTASFVDLGAQTVLVNDAGVVTSVLSPTASATALVAPGGKYAYPGDASANAETAIITQKWIALNVPGASEAFNEIRRTGIPNVPTSIYPGANAPNQITRIFYPFVEYQTNAANVAAQGTIDKFNSKIFWALGAN